VTSKELDVFPIIVGTLLGLIILVVLIIYLRSCTGYGNKQFNYETV
jgi:hypothetical protein